MKANQIRIAFLLALVLAISFLSSPTISQVQASVLGNWVGFEYHFTPDAKILIVTATFATTTQRVGTSVRFHIEVQGNSEPLRPNRHYTFVYSGDQVAVVQQTDQHSPKKAQVTFQVPIPAGDDASPSDLQYYGIRVTVYDFRGNILASCWKDPREGTAQ